MAQVIIQGNGAQNITTVKDPTPYISLINCVGLCADGTLNSATIMFDGVKVQITKE